MKIPENITKEHIKDSIVQVFCACDIPFEPMVGYLYGILGEMGYTYSNGMSNFQVKTDATFSSFQINQEIVLIPQHFYYNDAFKVQWHPTNSLIFNCINQYWGWNKYFEFITSILTKLSEFSLIKSYSRVGIRYISDFENVQGSEFINLNVVHPWSVSENSNSSLRLEWTEETHNIIVSILNNSLSNNLMIMPNPDMNKCRIDIDVIEQNLNMVHLEDLLSKISALHEKQKLIFFQLLKEEWKSSINPVY